MKFFIRQHADSMMVALLRIVASPQRTAGHFICRVRVLFTSSRAAVGFQTV
jgi:hypothetical protein